MLIGVLLVEPADGVALSDRLLTAVPGVRLVELHALIPTCGRDRCRLRIVCGVLCRPLRC